MNVDMYLFIHTIVVGEGNYRNRNMRSLHSKYLITAIKIV